MTIFKFKQQVTMKKIGSLGCAMPFSNSDQSQNPLQQF